MQARTINKTLHLPRFDLGAEQPELSERQLQTLKRELGAAWMEFSMCPGALLARVSRSFSLATGADPSIPFGDLDFLLVGDLCQLPPVHGVPMWKASADSTGSSTRLSVWRCCTGRTTRA